MVLEGNEKKTERVEKIHYKWHTPFLAKPSDFLVVQHDALNDPHLDLEKIMEDSLALGGYTSGRDIVPACEGDLFMLEETGELVLTHQNLGRVTKEIFKAKKGAGKAAYFNDVLEKYTFCPKPSSPRLCLELKLSTSPEAIAKVQSELAKVGIGAESAYFDSFFGNKLDLVGGTYAKSLHLWANVGSLRGEITAPEKGYDLLTVPRAMSFGEPTEPMVYGAVGSVREIEKAADNPFVLGVYPRIKKGSSVKMFLRSIRR